jgi:hypothetical protein
VIKKPRGRGGHSPRWAAMPEKIKKSIICLWLIFSIFIENVADMFHTKSNKNFAADLVTDARLATEKD